MSNFKSIYTIKQIENGYILGYPRLHAGQVEMSEKYYQSLPALTDFIKIHEIGEKNIHKQIDVMTPPR